MNRLLFGTACLALLASQSALAASVTLSGTILTITNSGGIFSAATVGSQFSAQFVYPNSAGPSTINEPDEADYELAGSGALQQGATAASGSAVSVNIQNDQPIDDESASFLNSLLTLNPPVATGARVDTFTLTGLQQGAFETDPNPSDNDDEEQLFNGVIFEFTLLTSDTSLYNNLDFRPFPPTFAQAQVRVFVVREADAAGNVIFEAYGSIDQLDVVQLFDSDFERPAPRPD